MQPERLGLPARRKAMAGGREIGGISVVAKASAARDFFSSFLIFQKRTRIVFCSFSLMRKNQRIKKI